MTSCEVVHGFYCLMSPRCGNRRERDFFLLKLCIQRQKFLFFVACLINKLTLRTSFTPFSLSYIPNSLISSYHL